MNTSSLSTANEIIEELVKLSDPERAKSSLWFFKTGPGQYGEGDKFLGLSVPKSRIVAKKAQNLPLTESIKLLHSDWHEARLVSLFVLVWQFEHADKDNKKVIFDIYLDNTNYVNNWDLVDSSAHKIVGPYLEKSPEKMRILTRLANSDSLWERRIAIVSTLYNSGSKKSSKETLLIAKKLVYDKEDLIQKAVGWALREVGKQVSEDDLLKFLDKYAETMPRTALRYSIERLSPEQKKHYMQLKKIN